MAGGMRGGAGVPLGQRRAAPATGEATESAGGPPPPARHCWVVDAPGQPGRWPGVLVEWRVHDGRWHGRVIYVVPEPAGGSQRVLERWLPAPCLRPA